MHFRPRRTKPFNQALQAASGTRRNDNSQHVRGQPASTCLSEQRSPPELAYYTPFTGANDSLTAQSGTEDSAMNTKPFSLLELPAELRELVYYYAVQPITPVDTGAIPGAPDRVRIPAIAQTSKQLREEVLHVLFKHRPAEIRMHSAYSFERALAWAKSCIGNRNSFGLINFAGRLEAAQNEFYHVTLEISDDAPYFEVRTTRRAASSKAELIIAHIMEKLLNNLDAKVKAAKKGLEGRLSGDSIADLIHLIDGSSRWRPPTEPQFQPWVQA